MPSSFHLLWGTGGCTKTVSRRVIVFIARCTIERSRTCWRVLAGVAIHRNTS